MPPRVIAIGDIHGCAVALRAMLDLIKPQPDDTIVTLGDCVDRGPDSCGVIEQLLDLREHCRLVPLLGNHEEMMLAHLGGRPQPDNWLLCGGDATVQSYSQSADDSFVPNDHVEYIRSWGDFFETDTHFFVHGAYHPEQPLSSQKWSLWRWHSLRDMLPAAHVSGKTAIVGHTSQKSGEVLDYGYLICIDTYCYGGGWLTALNAANGQIWQVNREGKLRDSSS
ncbi:MAG TPA: metallophosphoesterase family protein [Lacipirellulaceae bacterium]|jgi:serine/threonine protein phosphatase 1